VAHVSRARIVDRRFRSEFTFNDDGHVHTMAATRCAHCPCIIVQKPGHEQGINWDFCMQCSAMVCLRCARWSLRTGQHKPYEQATLDHEKRAILMEQLEARLAEDYPIDREQAVLIAITR
jgi:hypothetical protein